MTCDDELDNKLDKMVDLLIGGAQSQQLTLRDCLKDLNNTKYLSLCMAFNSRQA